LRQPQPSPAAGDARAAKVAGQTQERMGLEREFKATPQRQAAAGTLFGSLPGP